jgi:hypothetical protein
MKNQPLSAAVQDVLQQGLALLDDCTIEGYRTIVPAPFEASIGQHYRHVLDHFVSLTMGISTGVIDYDQRARDRELENNIDVARASTQMLMKFFASLTPHDHHRLCSVLHSISYRGRDKETSRSNIERELAYCVSHAVHHFAIVRILCAQLEVKVPAEFGIAPSTLKHRATVASN